MEHEITDRNTLAQHCTYRRTNKASPSDHTAKESGKVATACPSSEVRSSAQSRTEQSAEHVGCPSLESLSFSLNFAGFSIAPGGKESH